MTSQLSKPDTELAPCPFCGGKASFYDTLSVDNNGVCCDACGVDMAPHRDENRELIALRWSSRPVINAQGQLCEQCSAKPGDAHHHLCMYYVNPAWTVPPQQSFQCMGRKQSLPEPGECNWPDCGCDPHATKVIAALQEQGVCLEIHSQEAPAPHDSGLYTCIDAAIASPDRIFNETCPRCGGSGDHPGGPPGNQMCPDCDGRGFIPSKLSQEENTGTVSLEQLREVIAAEWGSAICYHEPVYAGRKCDPDTHCRCTDIARAIQSDFDVRAKR